MDERHAATAQRVFELFVEGLTYVDIARRLTAEGRPNRSGRPWNPNTIRCIVTNTSYRGKVNAFGQEYDANLPQTIPPQTLAAAAALLDELRSRPQRKNTPKGEGAGAFNGLLRCPECGRWLYSDTQRSPWGKVYVYYRCQNAIHFPPTCVNKRLCSQLKLEESVLPMIFRHIRALAARTKPPAEPRPEQGTRKRRGALDDARRRAVRAHTLGHISEDELADELEHITAEARALDAAPPPPRPVTQEQIKTLLAATGKRWKTHTPNDRATILETVIAHILPQYDDLAKSQIVWRV